MLHCCTLLAVSYTHLDVYKRQGFSGTAFEFGIHVEERAIRPLGNAAAKGAFARAHEAQ